MRKRKYQKRAAVLLAALLLAGCGEKQTGVPYQTEPSSMAESREENTESAKEGPKDVKVPDWVDVQLIPVHGVARRGEKLEGVKDIVLHYVGNPGTSAQANRDFFAMEEAEVSAHFVVGLEGEIIQCVPLDEKSSASNHRNKDTISIETCHPDATGKYTQKTYEAEVKLVVWLCRTYGLTEKNVIRHYEVTGKDCPKYFVENEKAWEQFLQDVKEGLEKGA